MRFMSVFILTRDGRLLKRFWRTRSTTNAVESVNASFRKVVRRGCFPDEDAVMKLLYLRVKELYSRWGEGCHQPGWARVRNQLLCDEGIRARIERFL